MHAVVDAAAAHDIDGQQAVRVRAGDELEHGGLVGGGGHGDGVVPRGEDEVGERAGADGAAGHGQVQGHVAEGDGEDGGVGDADRADEVGAVRGGGEGDGERGDGEAGEAVES